MRNESNPVTPQSGPNSARAELDPKTAFRLISEQPGSGFTEAPDGATLPTKEPFDKGAALEKGSALLDKSSALADNLQDSVTVFHAPAGEPGTGFPHALRSFHGRCVPPENAVNLKSKPKSDDRCRRLARQRLRVQVRASYLIKSRGSG